VRKLKKSAKKEIDFYWQLLLQNAAQGRRYHKHRRRLGLGIYYTRVFFTNVMAIAWAIFNLTFMQIMNNYHRTLDNQQHLICESEYWPTSRLTNTPRLLATRQLLWKDKYLKSLIQFFHQSFYSYCSSVLTNSCTIRRSDIPPHTSPYQINIGSISVVIKQDGSWSSVLMELQD
jgi:hypothetical protein